MVLPSEPLKRARDTEYHIRKIVAPFWGNEGLSIVSTSIKRGLPYMGNSATDAVVFHESYGLQ